MSVPESVKEKYELVVGLEVHAQLSTHSKAYSRDANEYGDLPNTHVSVVTLAHPGTLPRSNKTVVEYAIKMGLACGSQITEYNFYDRKNYFYPDLPKGYQLTQDKTPICVGGEVPIKTRSGIRRTIKITRIHMEEDAGKSMHLPGDVESLIDLNRAGVPLIEIVSEPDIRHSEEAYAYLTEIRRLVRYLDICDGNMEEGSLRCDANVSVRLKGETRFGNRVEIKNMNSFRNVQRAIDGEMERQIAIIEAGGSITSETRMYDASKDETYSLRTKESLNDYRYFPEPDLQPIVVNEAWREAIRATMPPLPNELHDKFTTQYGLPEYDAGVLTDAKEIALYFEAVCQYTTHYKAASNWVMGPVKSYLNELTLHMDQFPISAQTLAGVVNLVDSGKVSHAMASQKIFPALLQSPDKTAEQVATELNLFQSTDTDEISALIEAVLDRFPDKVKEYHSGKKGLLGMFMGEVMKASKGKAEPKTASALVEKALAARA